MRHRKLHGLKDYPVTFRNIIGNLSLTRLLDSCTTYRLYLCGTLAEMTREYVEEPTQNGWELARTYIHKFRSPIYRTRNHTPEISRAVKLISESWFPKCDNEIDAGESWAALKSEWKKTTGLPLLSTPSKTGQALLWESFPLDEEYPPLEEDLVALIRSISPQHRNERFGPEREAPFQYDGRLMYAGLATLDRLPIGAPDEVNHFVPFIPGWYFVKVTIPKTWAHIGLIPFPMTVDGTKTWIHPAQAGEEFETWASEPELTIAQAAGWHIEVKNGWRFSKGRPLGRWAKQLIEMRDRLKENNPYAASAIREILNHTIGSFHADTYEREGKVDAATWRELINEFGYHRVVTLEKLSNGMRRVTYPAKYQDDLSIFMPHWSAQIWALERARVAQAALSCDPRVLVEINGDAISATAELPIKDNGNPGQLRRKAA